MSVLESFFSFSLLAFAALLCILGVVILTDGIIRLTAESYKRYRLTPAASREREEKSPVGERAA
jgi:hypothetical protein